MILTPIELFFLYGLTVNMIFFVINIGISMILVMNIGLTNMVFFQRELDSLKDQMSPWKASRFRVLVTLLIPFYKFYSFLIMMYYMVTLKSTGTEKIKDLIIKSSQMEVI